MAADEEDDVGIVAVVGMEYDWNKDIGHNIARLVAGCWLLVGCWVVVGLCCCVCDVIAMEL